MRAIVCAEPKRLVREERPLPDVPAGWVEVDVRHVGICGTDYHIFDGTQPFLTYPRVMGHELSGTVARSAGAFKAGDGVIVNPYISCGSCVACRKGKFNCCTRIRVLGVHTDGGMCERIVMPEGNLYPAGDLPLEHAAMVEFLAIGAHAVARGETTAAKRSLVIGGGPIGIAVALFARIAGSPVTLVDLSEKRLAFAADRLGFKDVVRAGPGSEEALKAASGGEGFDLVFDATGSARSMMAALAHVAHGGELVYAGLVKDDITFSDPELHKREAKIVATRNALKADFEHVVASIRSGAVPVAALNTHSGSLDDLPEAMPAWLAHLDDVMKVVVAV